VTYTSEIVIAVVVLLTYCCAADVLFIRNTMAFAVYRIRIKYMMSYGVPATNTDVQYSVLADLLSDESTTRTNLDRQ